MVIKLSGFAEIFVFFTPAPVVAVVEDRHIMECYQASAVVECLTRERGVVGFSITSSTMLCPQARHINPCLVLVQPRKTHPNISENFLTDVKNQIKQKKQKKKQCYHEYDVMYDVIVQKNLLLFEIVYNKKNSNTPRL